MMPKSLVFLVLLAAASTLAACSRAAVGEAPVAYATSTGDSAPAAQESAMRFHDIAVTTIDGEETTLGAWSGKVVLVVNTASECGFTRQYGPLQELHARFHDQGFSVLGFPCNDFGGQEPGTSEEIAAFCSGEFGVTFPMFERIGILEDTHPLYTFLTEHSGEAFQGPVRWNFTKFLVSGEGEVLARFEPAVEPLSDEIVSAVEAALAGE